MASCCHRTDHRSRVDGTCARTTKLNPLKTAGWFGAETSTCRHQREGHLFRRQRRRNTPWDARDCERGSGTGPWEGRELPLAARRKRPEAGAPEGVSTRTLREATIVLCIALTQTCLPPDLAHGRIEVCALWSLQKIRMNPDFGPVVRLQENHR